MLKLKEIRENRQITQTKLANILKVSRSTYSIWELEKDVILIKHLIDISNYYNVSIDYLLNLTAIEQYDTHSDKINLDLMSIRLKEIRKENKLTQVKLSEILNVAKGTLANYECKRNAIATPFLYEICKKYNVSSDYLLGKVDNPKYLK